VQTDETPKAHPENLLGLIQDAHNGKIVLPEFQRSFVWGRESIEEFLASVLHGYFVGTFLMLDTSSTSPMFPFRPVEGLEYVNKQATLANPPTVRLVLDGQQRISSVFYALYAPDIPLRNAKHPYKFYLRLEPALEEDLDEAVVGVSVWERRRLAEIEGLVRDHRALPFTTLREPGKFYQWLLQEHQAWEGDAEEQIGHLFNRFQKFMVPVVALQPETGKDNIVNIFERINRTGVSLSPFDLAVARLYPKDLRLRELWQQFESKLLTESADLIKPEFLLKIIAIYQGKEPRKGNLLDVLDVLNKDDFMKAWTQAAEAIMMALARVRDAYGAFKPGWVPYTTLLVPLAVHLWELKHDAQAGEAAYRRLDAWYWGSVFTQRYDSAVDTKSYRDFVEMRRWLKEGTVPEWLGRLPSQEVDLNVDDPRSAVYKGLMCLIARRGAKDFVTGQPANLNDCHDDHIFPKALYQDKHPVDTVLNRSLISRETNRRKSDTKPSEFLQLCLAGHDYNEGQLLKTLETHFITRSAYEALKRDDFEAFITARAEAISQAVQECLKWRDEW